MKKIISAVLALCMVMSFGITAFGETKEHVKKVLDTSVTYALDGNYGKNGYTVSNSKYFEMFAKSGRDVSEYKDAYFKSVKASLDTEHSSMDELVQIAAVLCALDEYPEELSKEALTAALRDSSPVISSPYNYVQAISVCCKLGLEDTAKAYADELCKLYQKGVGAVYWGSPEYMSADDIAMFLLALAPLEEDYSEYISDAVDVLEKSYYSKDGYISIYTGANTDSTALVLAAYSALGYEEKADAAYKMLVDNFYDKSTGGFKADYDSYYSTADAIIGLEYYYALVEATGNGWYYLDGKWYYLIKGAEQTGWQEIDGKWYYFNDSGEMQTGWIKSPGSGKWFYLRPSGAMATGWIKSPGSGKWFYLKPSGAMATGWQKVNGKWYYLKESGAMSTGWVKVSGKWYYLNENGAMRTANLTYKGKVYRFNSSGACLNP